MATYVIGDTHFGKNTAAVRTGSKTISEHDEKVIRNWNDIVKETDHVLHIGDVTEDDDGYKLIKRLNGIKTLVRGNNDKLSKRKYKKLGFARVFDNPVETDEYVISHEPIGRSIKSGKANIHGHSHGDDVISDTSGNTYINKSMDAIKHKPSLLSDAIMKLKKSKYRGSRYRPSDVKQKSKHDIEYRLLNTSESRGLPSFKRQKELAKMFNN